MPISHQFMGESEKDKSLSQSHPANQNVSDFPGIRNGRGRSRLKSENQKLEAIMSRGYSVSFLHPRQVKGRGSL